MPDLTKALEAQLPEITRWRRELHAHPEVAFEEKRTSELVAAKLQACGIEVHRGLACTGVVGLLSNGEGPLIGLRADMDALPIEERNDFAHRSTHPGRMHACGHDGHTAMLLGAARLLAQRRRFRGSVALIFQPAEENEGGARLMMEQGLFERFPVDSIYGLHNWPGLPVGQIAAGTGALMAAFDTFDLIINGRGAHGGMPHLGVDAVVVAAQIVSAWQTIASRNVDPVDASVVSVTQIHGGDTWNVLPQRVIMRGTTRSFRDETRDLIERRMRELATAICAGFGIDCELDYQRRYPALLNTAGETEAARRAAAQAVGWDNVDSRPTPSMGAEDFAYMLRAKPGCYVWLGNGVGETGRGLHSPHYDFNDAALALGVSYWVRLAESLLPGS